MIFPSSLFSTVSIFVCKFLKCHRLYWEIWIRSRYFILHIFLLRNMLSMPHFPQIAFHFVWEVCCHIYSTKISNCSLNTPFIAYHVIFRKLFFKHSMFVYKIKLSTTSVPMQINSWCYNDRFYIYQFSTFQNVFLDSLWFHDWISWLNSLWFFKIEIG